MHKRKIKRQFKNFRIYKDLYGKLCKRNWVAKVVFLKQMLLKPGFHMIVQIVPITPVVSKYFETIQTIGVIGSFHMIASIALKARDLGSLAMSLGQTIEFLSTFCKQANWMIFVHKANLVPWYLLFLLILRH